MTTSHMNPGSTSIKRRQLLKTGLTASALATSPLSVAKPQPWFELSLAQWSLHKAFFSGRLQALDFPAYTKKTFGIDAVEYVNQFFIDKAKDKNFLHALKKRCDDHGVTSVLIMCDNEGKLGNPNQSQRQQAVENHYKWLEAAKFLGCHSIRVNAASTGSYEEQKKLAIDGLRQLSVFAKTLNMNVLVENHGGLSSHGQWLAQVIKGVGMENCGTLPDFGNFDDYDRYQGVKELMPFAKGVSAKSRAFNKHGNETETDYKKMLQIVRAAQYSGYIGIEYEGKNQSENEGILLTKSLLETFQFQTV